MSVQSARVPNMPPPDYIWLLFAVSPLRLHLVALRLKAEITNLKAQLAEIDSLRQKVKEEEVHSLREGHVAGIVPIGPLTEFCECTAGKCINQSKNRRSRAPHGPEQLGPC